MGGVVDDGWIDVAGAEASRFQADPSIALAAAVFLKSELTAVGLANRVIPGNSF